MNNVCVIGSMNLDLVLNVNNLPKKGETLFVKTMEKIPGGKGANQAVAARRLNCNVYMISQIGDDENGDLLYSCLEKDGINTEFVFKDKNMPTGTAIITVDNNGNNTIAVVSGANMSMTTEQIDKAEDVINNCDVVIAQFETPIKVTEKAFEMAKSKGKLTILNPAPFCETTDKLLRVTDIIVPNETEVHELTGIQVVDLETAKKAANIFFEKGVRYVIITLGEKGAALITKEKAEIVKAYKVNAIDTTAAGDSFIGAVSSVLSKQAEINYNTVRDAVLFGNKVSSIAVTKKGAQISIPSLEEVIKIYGE